MDPDRQRAIELLRAGRAQIARATHRLAKRLDPSIAVILPEASATGSIANTIRAVEVFLATDDFEHLDNTVQGTVELRRLSGFGLPQVMAMSHCYLPVIRKVFLHLEPEPKRALEAFDVVESCMLPLIARWLAQFAERLARDLEDDTAQFKAVPRTLTSEPNPFSLVSVEHEITAEER